MPDIELSEVSCGDIHHAGLTKDLNLSISYSLLVFKDVTVSCTSSVKHFLGRLRMVMIDSIINSWSQLELSLKILSNLPIYF